MAEGLFQLACQCVGLGRARVNPGRRHARRLALYRLALVGKTRPARIVHQPQLAPLCSEAQISIVLAQQQSVLRARGKHAIGLDCAHGNQVVHQHADIGLIPARAPGLPTLGRQRRIEAGQQALGCRFFVTGGAVDLAGKIQAGYGAGFQ